MNVAELIEHLKTFPQELLVAYRCYSEQCLMEKDYIMTESLQPPRNDGWIGNVRPDKERMEYLVFPGN